MCGICGQFNFGNDALVDPNVIQRMMDTIVHRGPDDAGMFIAGPLGLGFRRLAILDLSPAGHQPMSDPEQSVWVVFNGEIYNFQEIRKELEEKGHRFKSQCDTEVVVLGYKEWGEDILTRLNGMFGVAIWDVKSRKLVVARDPMGIKPIYYSVQNGTLWFGSEIRPVRAAVPEPPAVNLEAIALFLRYRYAPAPHTMFAGIQKLAAGEKIVVKNGRAEISRYYGFEPVAFDPQPGVEEATEKLLELYKAALHRHLISDVPLGLLLSGGIDSGLLLGLMNLYGQHWPTFTIGYGSSFRDDELDDAAETARIYGAQHHSIRIDQRAFEDALPRIVDALEEPVASSSIVPMYFVCQHAREAVKVALIGQGPDELFGGYNRHLGVQYGAAWRSLPSWMRRGGAAIASHLPRNDTVRRGLASLAEDTQLQRFQKVFSVIPEAMVMRLFQPDSLPDAVGKDVMDCWKEYQPAMGRLDELNAFQLLELRSSLPDELLMYGDKLSMAHSLEARVPFLDRELVEYIQQLGSSFKVRRGVRKWLHRRVCRHFLPADVMRRKKRGFAVNVVDEWFRQSLQGRIKDYLADDQSLIYRYLRPSVIADLLQLHSTGREDNHKILFSLVVLEQWLRSNTAYTA